MEKEFTRFTTAISEKAYSTLSKETETVVIRYFDFLINRIMKFHLKESEGYKFERSRRTIHHLKRSPESENPSIMFDAFYKFMTPLKDKVEERDMVLFMTVNTLNGEPKANFTYKWL